jgi:hypothetical protein
MEQYVGGLQHRHTVTQYLLRIASEVMSQAQITQPASSDLQLWSLYQQEQHHIQQLLCAAHSLVQA